jgi:hypothetical protein
MCSALDAGEIIRRAEAIEEEERHEAIRAVVEAEASAADPEEIPSRQ